MPGWVPSPNASRVSAPWEAAPLDLAAVGVVLGDTYPAPIVDHSAARERTLSAYSAAREIDRAERELGATRGRDRTTIHDRAALLAASRG